MDHSEKPGLNPAAPEKSGQNQVEAGERNGRGQFRRGVSGNPGGKPRGTRSRTTVIGETILAKHARALLERAVAVALADRGGPTLRALLPFLIAPQRERPMAFALPPMKTAADALTALDAIRAGIEAGQLTQSEADTLTALVARFVDAIKANDLDARIAALEQRTQSS